MEGLSLLKKDENPIIRNIKFNLKCKKTPTWLKYIVHINSSKGEKKVKNGSFSMLFYFSVYSFFSLCYIKDFNWIAQLMYPHTWFVTLPLRTPSTPDYFEKELNEFLKN